MLGKKREHRNKTLPEKVATTCTEDGHKQTTKSGYNMYRWTQTDNQKWLQHVQMDTNTITKVATTCTDGHRLPKVATTCTENGHRLPKVATTCTEDGHKQTTKSGYNMYRGWTQTDYRKWLQHVQMDTDRLPKVATTCTEDGHRLPKQALQYKPKGRRHIGRPRKRWRDQLHLEDQRTGNTLKPSGT